MSLPYNMMAIVMTPVIDEDDEDRRREEMVERLGPDYVVLPADYTLPVELEDDDAPAA
jgi:hypothetical protein